MRSLSLWRATIASRIWLGSVLLVCFVTSARAQLLFAPSTSLYDYGGIHILYGADTELCRHLRPSLSDPAIEFPQWALADNVDYSYSPGDHPYWAEIDFSNQGRPQLVLTAQYVKGSAFSQWLYVLSLDRQAFLARRWNATELISAHAVDAIDNDGGGHVPPMPFYAHRVPYLDQARLPRGYQDAFSLRALVTPFRFQGKTYVVFGGILEGFPPGVWKASRAYPKAPVSTLVFEYPELGRRIDRCYLSRWLPPETR
jgi:hypothetical protein